MRGTDRSVSGYAAWISATRAWRLVKYPGKGDSVFLTDWQSTDALAAGDMSNNTVGLYCKGDQITLLVNGRAVTTVRDSDFPDGGVAVMTTEAGLQVAFTHLRIDPEYKLAAPAP